MKTKCTRRRQKDGRVGEPGSGTDNLEATVWQTQAPAPVPDPASAQSQTMFVLGSRGESCRARTTVCVCGWVASTFRARLESR